LIVYFVNDAPFSVAAEMVISAASESSLKELSGFRTIEPITVRNGHLVWQTVLQPYDFVAVILNDSKAVIHDVNVVRPPAICGVNGLLKRKVELLSQQIHSAHSGVLWDKLGNSDFETFNNESNETAGWRHWGSHFLSAQLDAERKKTGQHSLRLTGISGIENESGIIFSEPFEPPTTGQLFVSLYVGIKEDVTEKTGSLPLEVILSAQKQGEPLFLSYCVEPVFLPLLVKTLPQHGVRWYRVLVPFTQLPTTGLSDFCIGFRLFGTSTVWIDNVTLYRMTFTSNEIKSLQQIALAANNRYSSDRVSDLLAILEGYWVQYLFHHIPVPSIPTTTSIPATSIPTQPSAVIAKESKPYTSKVSVTTSGSPSPKKEEQSLFNRIKGWFVK
jgi:hypothetical protein